MIQSMVYGPHTEVPGVLTRKGVLQLADRSSCDGWVCMCRMTPSPTARPVPQLIYGRDVAAPGTCQPYKHIAALLCLIKAKDDTHNFSNICQRGLQAAADSHVMLI